MDAHDRRSDKKMTSKGRCDRKRWLAALCFALFAACGANDRKVDAERGGSGGNAGRGGSGAGGSGAPAEAGAAEGGSAGNMRDPQDGGSSGVAGADVEAGAPGTSCASLHCDANANCIEIAGEGECRCRPGFVGDGVACSRPSSCKALKDAMPELGSGPYWLRPPETEADFQAYCDMQTEGGGWTLVLNEGLGFDPAAEGVDDDLCYASSCANRAYSTVLLEADVMLDMKDGVIAGDDFAASATFTSVDPDARGKTVRELFTTGPFYLDEDDNSNVSVRLRGDATATCLTALPRDVGNILCDDECSGGMNCGYPVMVLGDADSTCAYSSAYRFALGAASSRSQPWTQCAGWPQSPNLGETNFWPDNVRVWIR